MGPGKDAATGLDFGRFAETGDEDDRYRFRTPPLRNVTATGPYMHNGSYADLESAVRHHLNPRDGLLTYAPFSELPQEGIFDELVTDREVYIDILSSLDIANVNLTDTEVARIMDFLDALEAPNLQLRLQGVIPATVPSGLPVDQTLP